MLKLGLYVAVIPRMSCPQCAMHLASPGKRLHSQGWPKETAADSKKCNLKIVFLKRPLLIILRNRCGINDVTAGA